MARGAALAGAGALAVATMGVLAHFFYDIDGYGWGFFMTAFGYSLVALAFALLVAAALSPAARPLQWRIPGARSLALWSYSIYLSHKPLAWFLGRRLDALEVPGGVRLALIAVACVTVGALLYRLVERPFMALRDRRVPSNFREGTAGGGLAQPVSP
jgi:peptidoglycan/LPS O-acetylase OafA/YrhL